MTTIGSFKDLDAYKKSYQLALQIYRMTRQFPVDEKFGLTSQLRRAAVSIPSNIAEGYRRCSRIDYIRFLKIAFGSCGELETQLDLCRDMDLVSGSDHERISALSSDVSKMLYRLIRALRQSGAGSRALEASAEASAPRRLRSPSEPAIGTGVGSRQSLR